MPDPRKSGSPGWGREAGGFTLIELLVVVSIIALLLSIILPSLRSVRQQAKTLICMDHLRTASFHFGMFADPYSHRNRGNSTSLGTRFWATDFLDSLYETDEFWTNPGLAREDFRPGQEPILCPAGPAELARVRGRSCHEGGLDPRENISYAMNRRLFEAPVFTFRRLDRVYVPESVLNHPNVPLFFDADGAEATLRHLNFPIFAAPPGTERTPYATSHYWHPSLRHRGKMTIGFVGGQVVSTRDPFSDSAWEWEYYPDVPVRPR